ncbi:MAG TPA: 3-phosphoshikimate 1-carboxyvinyltransferase, partial [Gammaproteobacteria bacterium]|nr:3-phosphoshikimate 1-carboxyvinyltransferase [Gammaproteobacteria bacterium]
MKKILEPLRHPLCASLEIPGSKSVSNRALLLATLADGVSEINNIQVSEDIRVFIRALTDLGVSLHFDEKARKVVVRGCQGQGLNKQVKIWCGESGTLARFMLIACAGLSGSYYFDGAASLRKRPMTSGLQVLAKQGMICLPETSENLPLALHSPVGLAGGKIVVDGSQTGQVISALLMIAPFARSAVTLQVENLVSRSYVNLSCSMMAEFGVQVEDLSEREFFVAKPQAYLAQ